MAISAAELARMQATAEDHLPDTCTIQVVTQTMDEIGGWSESWADTYTSVACRLAAVQARAAEAIVGAELAAVTSWVLTVAHDQALDETMRVVHDSEAYEIVQIEDTQSWRTAKRAYLRRVD